MDLDTIAFVLEYPGVAFESKLESARLESGGTERMDRAFRDLAHYLEPAGDAEGISFAGKYPEDFFVPPCDRIPVWHRGGGLDPVGEDDVGNHLAGTNIRKARPQDFAVPDEGFAI